jgi:hypothetical protein
MDYIVVPRTFTKNDISQTQLQHISGNMELVGLKYAGLNVVRVTVLECWRVLNLEQGLKERTWYLEDIKLEVQRK